MCTIAVICCLCCSVVVNLYSDFCIKRNSVVSHNEIFRLDQKRKFILKAYLDGVDLDRTIGQTNKNANCSAHARQLADSTHFEQRLKIKKKILSISELYESEFTIDKD